MNNINQKIAANRRFATWGAVIDCWPYPSNKTFSSDLGVPYGTATCWKQRNRIPPEYWLTLLGAAKLHGIHVTAMDLVALAATYKS